MLALVTCLIAQLCRTSGFIDIPTVPQYDIKGMLGGSIVLSIPMYSEDPYPGTSRNLDPADFNMVFRYGLGRSEVAVSAFQLNTYSLSFSHLLKKEDASAPAIFTGIDDISYNANISTLGTGEELGFLEERGYAASEGGRPWELFSAYIAMQKSFGSMLAVVLGLGRGRFMGNSWRSHIFNTDLFVVGDNYTTKHFSWWAFGLFMGGVIKFPFGLDMMVEMDGRDANFGFKYHTRFATVTLALVKVEYLGSFRPWTPRWAFGLEADNRSAVSAPQVGHIECIIQDLTSKELLVNSVIEIREISKRYKAAGGSFSLSLPAGNYTLKASKPNFVDYVAKITVRAGVAEKFVFNLQKTPEALMKEMALKEKQKNIAAYFSQGKAYYTEGNIKEAKKSFEMVLSLDPDHAEAKTYLANVEIRRRELVTTYINEAKSHQAKKEYAKAIESWQKVLDLEPASAEATAALAELKKKVAVVEKKPPPGEKPKEPAPKITAEEIQMLYKKGVNMFTAENYDEALKIFKQVLVHDSNHKGAKDYKKRTEARIKALKGG